MVNISWEKSTTGRWCRLRKLNLSTVRQEGVYIIWVPRGWVIRVGQGDVDERLRDHQDDEKILSYESIDNPLRVTCGELDVDLWDGVERFLANTLRPVLGIYPRVRPIPVNLPQWGRSGPE